MKRCVHNQCACYDKYMIYLLVHTSIDPPYSSCLLHLRFLNVFAPDLSAKLAKHLDILEFPSPYNLKFQLDIYIYTHNYITIYTLFFFIPRAGNKTAHKNIPKNTSPMRKKMGLEFWRYRKSEMAEMQSICHETNPARQRCHPNDYYPGISTDYSYIISHLPIKHLQQTLIIKIYLLWLCKQL